MYHKKEKLKIKFLNLDSNDLYHTLNIIRDNKDKINYLSPYIVACLYNSHTYTNLSKKLYSYTDVSSTTRSYDIEEFERRGFIIKD